MVLRKRVGGWTNGTANGTEQDGIGVLRSGQGLLGKGLAGGIDGGLVRVRVRRMPVAKVWREVRTPPRRWCWKLNLTSGLSFWITSRIWECQRKLWIELESWCHLNALSGNLS